MAAFVTLMPVSIKPDPTRTVVRPFELSDPDKFSVPGHSRAQRIVDRVMALQPDELEAERRTVMASLDERHRDVDATLMRRFEELEGLTLDRSSVDTDHALLIGAYFSEEFSYEAAALFNPSATPHPDQSGLAEGDTRFVVSLRGIGEGHVSSMAFRTGVWKADGSVALDAPSRYAVGPTLERETGSEGQLIAHLHCGGSREISETVIFPFLPSQGRGIEDVRLVHFTDEDGSQTWRGTFTAFNGSDVRQGLLQTDDFRSFEMRGVLGELYQTKGMALFPRKVHGRYMMLGRQDNENVWLVQSDDLYHWNGGEKVVTPRWPWEFVQMGNCGSPIEIDEGFLVLTHGVGTVRNYCVGACLLDKDDPSKLLARVTQPVLEPSGERDGYVPNVVYSCGGFVRERQLLLPYGVADTFSNFATLDIDALLGSMS